MDMIPSFDKAAAQYDESFTHTFTGKGQRDLVWKRVDQLLNKHPNKVLKILEINCGTGEDAQHFAHLGHHVLATDISPNMIKRAEEKYANASIKSSEFRVVDINEIEKIEGNFDVIFSNFGGLNCLSPNQLKQANVKIEKLLNVNGMFIAVIMSRKCALEQLYFLLKKSSSQRLRRQQTEPLEIVVEGNVVPTWFYNPTECKELMTPSLKVQTIKPIGIGYPPSYLNSFYEKHTFLKGVALIIEDLFGNCSKLSNRADHFLISFTKE